MRGASSLLALALGCLVMSSAPAAAQHEHHAAASVVISHDASADGFEFVGNLAHFGILDVGDDVIPDYHQQNHVRVSENGAVLFETTPDSGHDYDGVYLFDVAFPVAGHYAVEDLDDSGQVMASFNGTVIDSAAAGDLRAASIQLDGPQQPVVGVPAHFVYSLQVQGPDGGHFLNHTDAWFEVRRGDDLVFRTKTHSHTENQDVLYAFPLPGAYRVSITGFVAFPGPTDTLVAPVTVSKDYTVLPSGVPDLTGVAPTTPMPPDPPLMNRVAQGVGSGPYQLIGTYDPWTTVGPATEMHLTALVMDPATREPVQHVNFEATLRDMAGRTLFSSPTLHEYDGIWEFTAVEPVGQYVLSVDATAHHGNFTGHMDLPYTVAPPALAVMASTNPNVAAGAEFMDVTGLDALRAGPPFTIGLFAHDALGNPFQHAETDFVLAGGPGNGTVLAGKLHTHESGRFQFNASLPEGTYTLRLSPFPLEPRPAVAFYGPAPGSSLAFPFTVGAGPGFPSEANVPARAGSSSTEEAPALAPFALVVALAGAALLGRRRA
jgi:hypothetical protein